MSRRVQVLLAALATLLGHVLSVAAAVFTAQLVSPAAGGGFEDLGAAIVTLLVGQVLLGVACLGATVYFLIRNDRLMGLTVAASWLLGMFMVAIFIGSRST